jgi:hypothetical protein
MIVFSTDQPSRGAVATGAGVNSKLCPCGAVVAAQPASRLATTTATTALRARTRTPVRPADRRGAHEGGDDDGGRERATDDAAGRVDRRLDPEGGRGGRVRRRRGLGGRRGRNHAAGHVVLHAVVRHAVHPQLDDVGAVPAEGRHVEDLGVRAVGGVGRGGAGREDGGAVGREQVELKGDVLPAGDGEVGLAADVAADGGHHELGDLRGGRRGGGDGGDSGEERGAQQGGRDVPLAHCFLLGSERTRRRMPTR